jgi:hypothetical protein
MAATPPVGDLRPAAARPSPPLPLVPALSMPFPEGRQGADGPPSSIVFSRPSPLSPIVYSRDTADHGGAAGVPGAGARDAAGAAGSATTDAGGAASGVMRKPGDRISARLLTGIIVASGVPSVPVVAESPDGTVWLGRAAAEADGRVDITFTAPAAGVALEPGQLAAGLPGRLVVRRRAAAAAAIGAVAQAAADYTQAVARAQQISVEQGAAQVTIGGAAPGWTYAASRLADALGPQAAGIVETLEIAAGTHFLILLTGAP